MGELVSRHPDNIEPSINIPLDHNPAAVYVARLSTDNSRYGMRWVLNLAASILSGGQHDFLSLNWTNLKYQHLAALKSKLASTNPTTNREKPYAYSTINMIISGVKGVMKEAWKMELISDAVYLRIKAEEGLRGESLPAGRALTDGEVRALFQSCNRNGEVSGVRDTALLAVLLGAGLRRAELSDLDIDDWHNEDRLIVVRQGKGRRPREVPISTKVNQTIQKWIRLRGEEPGPLFTTIHVGDLIYMNRIRPAGIYSILERRYIEAGIEKVSPHDCRRTYITNLLSNGNDLASVAKLAGHKSVETTVLYDRRGLESLREAAESLELPC
jgi:integrase